MCSTNKKVCSRFDERPYPVREKASGLQILGGAVLGRGPAEALADLVEVLRGLGQACAVVRYAQREKT